MVNVRRLKLLFLVIVLVTIASSAFYISSYRRKIVPSVTVPQLDTKADVVINDVELTESTGNQLLWTLSAKTAEIFNDPKETRLTQVNAQFFDEEGKALRLKGDEGLKSDTDKTITITGNVLAVNEDGVKLQARQLVYDTVTGFITSQDPVTIEKGNTITTGENFKARVDIKAFKLERKVKTTILSPPEHPVEDESSSYRQVHETTASDSVREDNSTRTPTRIEPAGSHTAEAATPVDGGGQPTAGRSYGRREGSYGNTE